MLRHQRLDKYQQFKMEIQIQRAADYVAQRLYEAGCRYAFGIPGGEVLTIIDALKKVNIEFILAKHENCAGFMAEGVWHLTSAPAVVVATIGPGAMNAVNVVANAMQDRVPMIVLTGCMDATDALSYTHQVIDHGAVFAPITKQTFRLTAAGADIIADKAVARALQPRAGPVHIDIPISTADECCELPRLRRMATPEAVTPVAGDQISLARNWLNDCTRAIMIAGLDAVAENASESIRRFCEHFGMPVITTYKGKGLVPETSALSLGAAGLSPLADNTLIPLIQNAELIICAGYDPIEMRVGWREVWDLSETRVIDICHEPPFHYMHQSTLNFVASIGPTLDLLRHNCPSRPLWPVDEVAAAKKQLRRCLIAADSWSPASVIAHCQAAMPADTLATADSGAHRILLSQMWTCNQPATLFQSSGLCTMGCAVPLAIGLKLAAPSRPVIAFCGDAGMLMVAGEMSTAAELGQNTIFVVFADASLALIEMKQRQRQLSNIAVDFGKHDFAALARAFGGNGFTVRTVEELKAALSVAQDAQCFTLIAAVVDRKSYDHCI